MVLVRALCSIRRNPKREMIATGQYDSAGNAILRSNSQIVRTGQLLEIEDEGELQELLAMGAVRQLDEIEMEFEKQGVRYVPQ